MLQPKVGCTPTQSLNKTFCGFGVIRHCQWGLICSSRYNRLMQTAASKTRIELTFIVPLIRYMLLLQHTTHLSKAGLHQFTEWEKQTVHSGEEVTGQPPSPGSCAVTSIYIFPTRWFLIQKCVSTDPEGCQRVDPAGLPEGGGAADGAPAPAHCAILRRVHRRRAAGHGVRVYEARRPQPLSPVCTPHLLGPQELNVFILRLKPQQQHQTICWNLKWLTFNFAPCFWKFQLSGTITYQTTARLIQLPVKNTHFNPLDLYIFKVILIHKLHIIPALYMGHKCLINT